MSKSTMHKYSLDCPGSPSKLPIINRRMEHFKRLEKKMVNAWKKLGLICCPILLIVLIIGLVFLRTIEEEDQFEISKVLLNTCRIAKKQEFENGTLHFVVPMDLDRHTAAEVTRLMTSVSKVNKLHVIFVDLNAGQEGLCSELVESITERFSLTSSHFTMLFESSKFITSENTLEMLRQFIYPHLVSLERGTVHISSLGNVYQSDILEKMRHTNSISVFPAYRNEALFAPIMQDEKLIGFTETTDDWLRLTGTAFNMDFMNVEMTRNNRLPRLLQI